MSISLKFLEELKKSKLLKVIKVPIGHYNYEYATLDYNNATVFGFIELEHDIISDIDNKVIGHFGLKLSHNIIVYYLNI